MKFQFSYLLLLLVCLGGCGGQPDYIATPFFSEAAFSKIAVGMSEDRVRDLLGYPVSRFGPTPVSPGSAHSKIAWDYTVPASWEPSYPYHVFTVTFGPDRLVLGTWAGKGQQEQGEGAKENIERVLRCRRNIGDVVLTGFKESPARLAAGDPGVHVILLDRDCPAGTCKINAGPEWFQDAAPALLQRGTIAGVKHVYIGKHPDRYQEMVKALAPGAAGECYLRTSPGLGVTVQDTDSQMLLYKMGTLWSVTPADGFPHAQLGADDQKWLIRRLATGPDAPGDG